MALTKDAVASWAIGRGYKYDRYGHLVKTVNGEEFRMKISKIAVRYERKIHHDASEYSRASSEWLRLRSGYLKDLHIEGHILYGLR